MDEPFDISRIRVLEHPLSWARAHPSFFFADGVVSGEFLVEQLIAGARALGAVEVESLVLGGGFVVAARNDWFLSARFPIPEDFRFQAFTPFPELGRNCVRPECVVAAFARDVVVRGPSGTRVVQGAVLPSDPMFTRVVAATGWRRAIAFRGLGGVRPFH